jgi:hypothetical protein
MPHRDLRTAQGNWVCPPGEEYAQALHFFSRIQSSAHIDWVYQRNLRFLEDYLRASCSPVAPEMVQALRLLIMRKPGLSLLDVLERLTQASADDIYFCIATEQIHVALSQRPLADPQHVQVFLDREQAAAYVALEHSGVQLFPRSSSSAVAVMAGTMLWWDGKPWRVLNLGETLVSLLSPDKQVVDVPSEVFERLLREKKVTVVAAVPEDGRRVEELEVLRKASPKTTGSSHPAVQTAWRSHGPDQPCSRTNTAWVAPSMAFGRSHLWTWISRTHPALEQQWQSSSSAQQ